ncbi:expressed unknown protein [Seminavis robusta]|uniref:Uncharacterized protein n=1 Tax=Seminavis robusta TaxID=568900 RepID=A0A9N8DXX0_9STRA|nr:expressed unknown protein [Seminavis robusta]|eukprot:Sro454_g146290.1 n/a (194) ;mRNA; f:16281-16862
MAPSPGQRSHSSHSTSRSGSKTKSWIPEKVCQVGKNKLVACGAAWIDDTSAISDDLAAKVTAKAFALRMSYTEWDEGDEDESLLAAEAIYYGQVALIEEGKLLDETVTSQRSLCRMWTAKHKVTTETTEGIFRKFDKAHILIKGTPYVASFEEVLRDKIPKMNLSGCTIASDYGLDLCTSSKIYRKIQNVSGG